jgi:hypothetical protein
MKREFIPSMGEWIYQGPVVLILSITSSTLSQFSNPVNALGLSDMVDIHITVTLQIQGRVG